MPRPRQERGQDGATAASESSNETCRKSAACRDTKRQGEAPAPSQLSGGTRAASQPIQQRAPPTGRSRPRAPLRCEAGNGKRNPSKSQSNSEESILARPLRERAIENAPHYPERPERNRA